MRPEEVLDELFSIGNMTDEQFRAVKRLRHQKEVLQKQIEAVAGHAGERCQHCGQPWIENEHYCTATHDMMGRL